jgi:hypothetical protein
MLSKQSVATISYLAGRTPRADNGLRPKGLAIGPHDPQRSGLATRSAVAATAAHDWLPAQQLRGALHEHVELVIGRDAVKMLRERGKL